MDGIGSISISITISRPSSNDYAKVGSPSTTEGLGSEPQSLNSGDILDSDTRSANAASEGQAGSIGKNDLQQLFQLLGKLIEALTGQKVAEDQNDGESKGGPEAGGDALEACSGAPQSGSDTAHGDGGVPQDGSGNPQADTIGGSTDTRGANKPSETAPSNLPSGGEMSEAAWQSNPDMAAHKKDFQNASKLTGLPESELVATGWAESRGRQSTSTTNLGDGNTDSGVMQISQSRWNNDVLPSLSAQDKANIKATTGKDASQLNMSDSGDNIIGGAFHLKNWIGRAGGDIDKGHGGYVGGHLNNGDSTYVRNVNAYKSELAAGLKLSEDPAGQAGRLG